MGIDRRRISLILLALAIAVVVWVYIRQELGMGLY